MEILKWIPRICSSTCLYKLTKETVGCSLQSWQSERSWPRCIDTPLVIADDGWCIQKMRIQGCSAQNAHALRSSTLATSGLLASGIAARVLSRDNHSEMAMVRTCLISMHSHCSLFFLVRSKFEKQLGRLEGLKVAELCCFSWTITDVEWFYESILCKSMIQAVPWENELKGTSRRRQTEETWGSSKRDGTGHATGVCCCCFAGHQRRFTAFHIL